MSLRSAIAIVLLAISSTIYAGDTQPEKSGVVNGKPQGLFFMTRYWSYTHTLEKSAWYFSANGKAYENLDSGFSAQDLAAHKGHHGTFQINGDELKVTWSKGEVAKGKYELDGNNFMWEMGIFTPVSPIANKAAIAGVYEGGESLDHSDNRVIASKKLQLHADGSFEWEAVSFVAGKTPGTELYAGITGGATRGTWEISDYSLTLKANNGPTLRKICFPVDDKDAPLHPAHLYFGGTLFKKLSN